MVAFWAVSGKYCVVFTNNYTSHSILSLYVSLIRAIESLAPALSNKLAMESSGPQLHLDQRLLNAFSSPLTSPLTSPPSSHALQSSPPPSPHSDDDVADTLSGWSTAQRMYQDPISTQQKLQEFLYLLQQFEWSFKKFILAWVGAYTTADVDIVSGLYGTPHLRRKALYATLDDSRFRTACSGEVLPSMGVVKEELDTLVQQPYFGRFDYTASLEKLDFREAFYTIKDNAPVWHNMLITLLCNERGHRESYTGTDADADAVTKRAFMVTAMVCHARAKKRSNSFHSMLHVYLHSSGTKRRVIECLSGLGVCLSYHGGARIMKAIAEDAKVCILYHCQTPADSYKFLQTPANS